MLERLQKIIARAGIASRRHAEQLLLAGQVSVNGKVVTEPGTRADPERDHIKVSGKLVRFPKTKTYLVLHKPAGCVSTMHDPEGRRTLRDFLRGVPGRVFPVGRLEYHAQGLLLLTNDGELANRVLQAARSGGLQQTYWLKVKGHLTQEACQQLRHSSGARIRLLRDGANPWYEAVVSEPRRDALRRALAQLGHPVEKIKRVKLANLDLGSLPPGGYRHLTPEEVRGLERSVDRLRASERKPSKAARASGSAGRL